MSTPARMLLVNPRITARRNARFPLSLLEIVAGLQARGHDAEIIDGNVEGEPLAAVLAALDSKRFDAVGLSVMGGPQLAPAIAMSRAIRRAHPHLPIVWGGYFPSLYPDVALQSDYVDYLVRDQGENALAELLQVLPHPQVAQLRAIDGLSFRAAGAAVNNAVRKQAPPPRAGLLPYGKLQDAQRYVARTFLGARTVAHQCATGCRFRCTFCGVAAMFRGATRLSPAARLDQELTFLRERFGADSVQYYDHNFFDREEDMVPLLEVMARHELPWWCYARADALVNLSPASWSLVRRSRLRMAYIGAETPSDRMLKSIRKGTSADQTLEAAELCRSQGVIPELSFMVAPPENTEEETERTFDFIRQVKRVNPAAEIIVYIYTPLPAHVVPNAGRLALPSLLDQHGAPVSFPRTPEEWTERRWVDYACHADAPWVTPRLRQRIRDFVTVLRCRFPTVQDTRAPRWAKQVLRGMASWRYSLQRYDRPWELDVSQRLVRLLDPRATSL
jgi:radical SAM superfamily enzyme YgiQ (UPF0313 family)